jgi:hypothetical protein
VIIAVGDPHYKQHSLPVFKHYFAKHGIDYKIVEGDLIMSDYLDFDPSWLKVHPSWLKLLVYRMFPDYDYIICMDLDLLPKNPDVQFIHEFNMSKISMCVDTAIKHAPNSRFNEKFRYNCGLIGIPRTMAPFIEGVFKKHTPGTYPSWEQYYFNDELVDQGIEVHELPDDINCFFRFKESKKARCIHYTNTDHAKDFVEGHAYRYFREASR